MKSYSVKGMSCAACVARVEQAVKKVDGVENVSVSLLTNSMTVSGAYDEKMLLRAVERAGYRIGDQKEEKNEAKAKDEKGTLRLWISIGLLLCLMTLTMGHMIGITFPAAFSPAMQGICQLVLSLFILLLHRRFFIGGFRSALHGSPNMDTLVAMGSGVSFLYSLVMLILLFGKEGEAQIHALHGFYFESAAMILVLISVGKFLEEKSRGKTTDAIRALKALVPQNARVVRNGKEEIVPLEEIAVNDLLRILPGDLFPVDGEVTEGEGAVDEASLTGESIPVDKKVGDEVHTGTVNLNGSLLIRAERVGEDTTLSKLIERVTEAGASKAPIARLADTVSGVFVPVILLIAVITFFVWLLLGEELGTALSYGIAVLVVSCPCALGLATPVAIMVGNGVAARRGILFKTATSLEEAGKTEIVVLDKTGTVTTGKMQVSDVIPYGISREDLLSLAVSLEAGSNHPIANAVLEYGKEIESLPVTELKTLAGFGVEAKLENRPVRLGKAELIAEGARIPDEAKKKASLFSEEGKTVMHVSVGETYCGMMAVSDSLKSDSADAVQRLLRAGLRVVMITGDREETARSIAEKVGITEVKAGVLPQGKEEAVRALEREGKVMMVGDGINDAPALASASVGVAIGSGAQIAMDAAEVVLMGGSLSHVPDLIHISRKTLRNIKENLFWAFCYNLIGIPLAAGAFVPLWGWSLTPMFGAAAMSFSSLFVVSNALRLNRLNAKQKVKKEKKKMEKILKVEGMMCPHCEAHVKKALETLAGVEEAIPSHVKGEVTVKLSADVSDAVLKETVEKEGYKVL